MSSGKIHKANEGCACTMNSILEQFVAHLTLAEDEIALLDMEAGVEHFGRGTDNSVDGILMIVDPSFESLRLSAKIADPVYAADAFCDLHPMEAAGRITERRSIS